MSIGKFFKSIGQERIRVSLRWKQSRPEQRNVKRTERLKKRHRKVRKSSEEVGKRAPADLTFLSIKPGGRKLLLKTCKMLSVVLMFVRRRHFIHRLQTR